mmetsp:Transcript_20806/g.45052  ORF Transcript_20806/g.45052 Transcript_20806/m.45052 type:complete len:579 (-) Transcript_20806:1-1737(-)
MPRSDQRSFDEQEGNNGNSNYQQQQSGRSSNSSMNRNSFDGTGGGATGGASDGNPSGANSSGGGGGGATAGGRSMNQSNPNGMDSYGPGRAGGGGRMPGPHTPTGVGMGGGFGGEGGSPGGAGGGAMNPSMHAMYGMDGAMGHPNMMPGGVGFDMRGGPMGNYPGGDMERQMMQRRGGGRANGGQGGGPVPGGVGQGPNRQGMSQAEREEELLLNLLIARRQRGRTGGQEGPALRDELMRLRQQQGGSGGAMDAAMGTFGATGGGGAMQQGMPPMYDSVGMGPNGAGPANAFPAGDVGDQRIDRSHYMMDARTQEALMRQSGMGGGSGTKRPAAGMSYDPSGFGGNQLKYNPYNMMHPHPAMGHPQGVHPMHAGGGTSMGGAGGGPVMAPVGGMQPGTKKRRTHKKKPADMPRRPLSAYNLFFSEERERILKEISDKEEGKEESKDGDEGDDADDSEKKDEDKEEDDKKESEKPKALLRPLIPNQKQRRPHRKTHGKISFQKLARMVGERWKALPDDKRKYYQNLAQEDMKRQKEAMEEYYARQQGGKHGMMEDKPPSSAGHGIEGGDLKEVEPKVEP